MPQLVKSKRKPYASAGRSEPRLIESPPPFFLNGNIDFEKHLAKNADPKIGYLTYRRTGPGFLETYAASKAHNRETIIAKHSSCCKRIGRISETEYRIATDCFWIVTGIGDADVSEVYVLLMRTFAGSLVAINSAFELTLDGVYSNARPLMRQVYEGLMIAKLCSLDPTLDVYDRWLDGQQVNFTNDVLRCIRAPSTVEFQRFWRCLSGDTHASYHSGQPDFSNKPALEAAPLNFIFLQMLLEANYHLLCSHLVTRSIRYYQKAFSSNAELSNDQRALKLLFRQGKVPWMASGARTFIRDFRAKWSLAQVTP